MSRFTCTSFAASGQRTHGDSQFHAQNLFARCLQLESSTPQLEGSALQLESYPLKVESSGPEQVGSLTCRARECKVSLRTSHLSGLSAWLSAGFSAVGPPVPAPAEIPPNRVLVGVLYLVSGQAGAAALPRSGPDPPLVPQTSHQPPIDHPHSSRPQDVRPFSCRKRRLRPFSRTFRPISRSSGQNHTRRRFSTPNGHPSRRPDPANRLPDAAAS